MAASTPANEPTKRRAHRDSSASEGMPCCCVHAPSCWLQMPSARRRGKTPHMIDLLRFVSGLATDLVRRHGELIAENALLRQQLIVAVLATNSNRADGVRLEDRKSVV